MEELEPETVPESAQRVRSRARARHGGSQRRRDIVRRAAELFDEVGYHRASMDDLADAVGLAKPTLYYYFTGKEEILYKIHQEFISLLIQRQEARASSWEGDPADQLLEVMTDILELMRTHRGYVRVFFEHHREIPQKWHSEIVRQREQYQVMVEDVLRYGMRTGQFRQADVRMTALAVFGMCNWAYQWYQSGGPLEPRGIANFFLDLIGNGLFVHPSDERPGRRRRSDVSRADRIGGLLPRDSTKRGRR